MKYPGETKSQSAAEQGRLIDVLKDPKINNRKVYLDYMRENPSLDNKPDDNGQTPLHYLAMKNGLGILLLLEAGAKVDVLDNEGRSPLHIAASLGKTKVMRKLIRAGANVSLRDRQGRTPLSLFLYSLSQNRRLKEKEHNHIPYLKQAVYLIQKMRALGANVIDEASIGDSRNIGLFSKLPYTLTNTIFSFVGFESHLPPSIQYVIDMKPKFFPAMLGHPKIDSAHLFSKDFEVCKMELIRCVYAFDYWSTQGYFDGDLWFSRNDFDELTDVQKNLVCKELYQRPLIGFPFFFNKDGHTSQNDGEAVEKFLKKLYSFELKERENTIFSDLMSIKGLPVEQACQVVKGFNWILSSNCKGSWLLEIYSFQAIDRVIRQDKELIKKLKRLEDEEFYEIDESEVDESDSEDFEKYIFLCKYLQQLEMLFNIASIDLTQLRGEDKRKTLAHFLSRQSQQNAETAEEFLPESKRLRV